MKKNLINIFILMVIFIEPAIAGIEEIFIGKTSISKPEKLRDPFKPLSQAVLKKKNSPKTKKVNGIFSNINEVGTVALADVKVVGVLIGSERRAILQVKDKPEKYIINEGEKLGENNAEIKAIVPGGLILVEKVENIYGEIEYLETVIPISK